MADSNQFQFSVVNKKSIMVCFSAHLHVAVFAVSNSVFCSHSLYYVCKLDVFKPFCNILFLEVSIKAVIHKSKNTF